MKFDELKGDVMNSRKTHFLKLINEAPSLALEVWYIS